MTPPRQRLGTALLVVDVQVGVVEAAVERDAVVANVVALVDRARAAGTPVVWVMHDDDEFVLGSDGWQLVPELTPAAGEPVINKHFGDSFEATDLEEVLAGLGVGRLIVAGAQTDACITSTLHGAVARGYSAVLVRDAHTTEDLSEWGAPPPETVISHLNLMWGMHGVPGRETGTVATADVSFTG